MQAQKFLIIQIGFITLTILLLWTIFKFINLATSRSKTASRQELTNLRTGVIVWIIIVIILSVSGMTTDFTIFPPRLFLVLVIPFIFSLIFIFSSYSTRLLEVVPVHWLVLIQSFRIFVEVLLHQLYLLNTLPVQMTFAGRNFDIVAGILAPVFSLLIYRFEKFRLGLLILWNIGGIALLVNIILISILSMPGPLRYFENDPPNVIVGYFPVIFLPGILVPIAYLAHFLSLKQAFLKKKQKS